jgi:RNA polymerase sigma-70 factor (ECF subfamily)
VADPLENPEEAIRRVYAYVAYRIGAGPDAEDVTSATIERALRYRNSYRREDGSHAAWLIGIARRCIIDRAAVQGHTEPLDDRDPTDLGIAGSVADHTETAAARLDLRDAVARLDARSRDLVALRYGADLSSKDIGHLLSLSPGAVDVGLHRALAQLRAAMEGPSGT